MNLFTNLTLNYVLYFTNAYVLTAYWLWLLVGEFIAVVIESLTYLLIEPHKYELIPLTIAANILSFLNGIIFYLILEFLGIYIV